MIDGSDTRRSDAHALDIEEIVDLERHPLDDAVRTSAFIRECASRFARDGVCLLPRFLRGPALARAAEETIALLGKTFYCRNTHNAYLKAGAAPEFPAKHPRNRLLHTEVGSIANDYLPSGAVLSRLYAWDPLVRFIEGVTGAPALHRSADPLGALSVNVFEQGGAHEWHFDESRFSITLMLRPAERGGHFEYVPGVRGEDSEGYDEVGTHPRRRGGARAHAVRGGYPVDLCRTPHPAPGDRGPRPPAPAGGGAVLQPGTRGRQQRRSPEALLGARGLNRH